MTVDPSRKINQLVSCSSSILIVGYKVIIKRGAKSGKYLVERKGVKSKKSYRHLQ